MNKTKLIINNTEIENNEKIYYAKSRNKHLIIGLLSKNNLLFINTFNLDFLTTVNTKKRTKPFGYSNNIIRRYYNRFSLKDNLILIHNIKSNIHNLKAIKAAYNIRYVEFNDGKENFIVKIEKNNTIHKYRKDGDSTIQITNNRE